MDVQGLLIQMRTEQREDHQKLVDKVDEGFKVVAFAMNGHELKDTERFGALDKRMSIVESTRKTIRWLGATVVVALIGAAADFFFVHLPRLLGKP